MEEGYVKLWRKSLNGGMLKKHKLWVFWSWCLMKATWQSLKQDIGHQEIELLPGQFIFGRIKAAKELGMTERAIRTCLHNLETTQKVTIKVTNKFSIVTICKWDIYQKQENNNGQQNDHLPTTYRPATDHKQEVKEGKEIEEGKEKDLLVPDSEKPEPGRFDEDDMRIAELLSNLMTENNESRKVESDAQRRKWANTVRLMRERDNRTLDDIETAIKFSQNDGFWKSNILSMDTLRKQYDRLQLRMKGDSDGSFSRRPFPNVFINE